MTVSFVLTVVFHVLQEVLDKLLLLIPDQIVGKVSTDASFAITSLEGFSRRKQWSDPIKTYLGKAGLIHKLLRAVRCERYIDVTNLLDYVIIKHEKNIEACASQVKFIESAPSS